MTTWWRRQSPLARLSIGTTCTIWLAALLLVSWQYVVQEPETLVRRQELVSLMRMVSPPPGAELASESIDQKPGQVVIVATYRRAPAPEALRAYYDDVLSHAGWRLSADHVTGGYRVFCYQQSPYHAALSVGSDSRNQAEFILSMRWGMSCE